MSHEDKIVALYLKESKDIIYYGDSSAAFQAIEVLKGRTVFERPDFFAIADSVVWIIEHFAFDDTKRRQKASILKRDDAERGYFQRDISEEDVLAAAYQSCIRHTVSDYINNLLYAYDKHYSKIDEYRQHLISNGIAAENQKFRVCFVIEDLNPDGTTYWDKSLEGKPDGYPAPVLFLLHCDTFLSRFEESESVDCIISLNKKDSSTYCVSYLDRASLRFCKEQALSISEIAANSLDGITSHSIYVGHGGPGAQEIIEALPQEYRDTKFDLLSKGSWIYPPRKKK